jgi:hypothetical protein
LVVYRCSNINNEGIGRSVKIAMVCRFINRTDFEFDEAGRSIIFS